MNDLNIKEIREKLGVSQETLSFSAIHIECQRLTESVHENVHETP